MANNLFANKSSCCIARATISFAAAGFDATNTVEIYHIDTVFKSWSPNRTTNAITGFEEGKFYWINSLTTMDKETYIMPPLESDSEPPAEVTIIPGYTAVTYDTLSIPESGGVYTGAGTGYDSSVIFTAGQAGRLVHKYKADTNIVAFGWNGNGAQGAAFGDLFGNSYVDNGSLNAWTGNAVVAANVVNPIPENTFIGILREYPGGACTYRLQTSPDGITWTTVHTYAWNSDIGNYALGVYHLNGSSKHYYPQYIRL